MTKQELRDRIADLEATIAEKDRAIAQLAEAVAKEATRNAPTFETRIGDYPPTVTPPHPQRPNFYVGIDHHPWDPSRVTYSQSTSTN